MFKKLVKLLGNLSRIHIEAQSLPNLMVSRVLYMHSQLGQLRMLLFQPFSKGYKTKVAEVAGRQTLYKEIMLLNKKYI